MKPQLEADIQRVCLDWLRLFGAVVIRVNSGGFKVGDRFVRANSEPGCSDALVCLPGGLFCAIEFKRPGGKLTEKQKSFLDSVTAMDGLGIVVRSLDELRAALKAEGYKV